MLALVAPPVGRSLIAVALCCLPAALPKGLIALTPTDALDQRALVVVGDMATDRGVVDVVVITVTPQTVHEGRGSHVFEEIE